MQFLDKIKQRMKLLVDKSIASEEIQKQRIEMCNSCEHLLHFTRQCKKCGCAVDAKTKLSSSSCPVNKWQVVIFPSRIE